MHTHIYPAYRNVKKIILLILLFAAAILPTQTVHANIVSVTTAPSSQNVSINRTTSISLTWNVASNGPVGTSVTSTNGVFKLTVNGPVLGTVSQPLNGTTAPTPGFFNSSLIRFNERVLVPASVIAKARKLGANQILYSRIFSDNFQTMVQGAGSITLNITGSAGAGFSISREALSFTDK